jgi:putative nucleotidyltransferase with HDIG domain
MSEYSGELESKYFIEKNLECFTKKNIYDKNGNLLLSKDKKITDEIKIKLKERGNYYQEKSNGFDKKKNTVLAPIIQTFGERKNIRNLRRMEQPHKILNNIIFESKAKPWWIYVNALSNYVDWIYTHSIDVAMISLMMAVELGYNDKDQWNIGLGAFLHDVGKLLVPKAIIQKPGPLSDIETVCIRQHCELGTSSLKAFDLPKECTDIILQHHERLDGSGYPRGLKEDEISLNARIVMIADVLDGISSPRPYKQALKMEAAINILRLDEKKFSQELVLLLEKVLEI